MSVRVTVQHTVEYEMPNGEMTDAELKSHLRSLEPTELQQTITDVGVEVEGSNQTDMRVWVLA
jgi:hypothetical protein